MKERKFMGILLAILAAALYALNSPLSKLMLDFVPPVLMAGLLYIGAGIGMGTIAIFRKITRKSSYESTLTRHDLPYTLAMIALDVAAPIFLMLGLRATTAENASLLNNFEIVATAMIAFAIFGEKISSRLWSGIICVTLSCAILSFEDISSLSFSIGSLYVLLAALCWGIENNCTRKLSDKDPMQIVMLKGIFSGLGSLIIGISTGERVDQAWSIPIVLIIGFFAYGLSIFFYVHAQRSLGAARTSAYYAIAPFIGVILSLVIFSDLPKYTFYIALIIMALGAILSSSDEPIIFKKGDRK